MWWNFSKITCRQLFLQGFAVGSANKTEVTEWARSIESSLGFGPSIPPQPPKPRALVLPFGTSFVHQRRNTNPQDGMMGILLLD